MKTINGYTEREYKGFVITHLSGTMTFKAYDDEGELRACKSTLKDIKRAINKIIREEV